MSAKKSGARSPSKELGPGKQTASAEVGSPLIPPFSEASDSETKNQSPEVSKSPEGSPDDDQIAADDSSGGEISISTFRREVVALATQLVTAQISASAHLASANGIIAANKKIAAELLRGATTIMSGLESRRADPDKPGFAFVLQACSELHQAVDATIPPSPFLDSLDSPVLDRLFDGALARAQQMLRAPREDSNLIHAEQLFNPKERLVEGDAIDRFKEWKWPTLRNRNPCYDFFVRIERWFSEHLDELHADTDPLEGDARRLLWFLNFARERPEDDLSRKIFDLVSTHDGPPPDAGQRPLSLENLMAAVWRESFVWVIHGNRVPKPRLKGDTKMKRYYRPWGLFRYLRFFGDCNEEGREILASLSVERKELNADLSPYAIDPKTDLYHSFGPLDLLAKRREAQVVRKRLKQQEPE